MGQRSFSMISDNLSVPRKNTMDAPVSDSREMSSSSRVSPAGLVTIRVSETPFRVYCVFSAAEAANSELTPGTTLTSTPCCFSSAICSTIEPYREGSPLWRRTTLFPALAAATMADTISSIFMPQLSNFTSARDRSTSAGLTSDPA